jgi:asparagine synthase (glutamine-hydrolysing)
VNAIGGMFSRDMGSLDPALIQDLSCRLEGFGPDGEHVLYSGPTAFVERSLWTDNGAPSRGPRMDSEGYIIAFSGRIDDGLTGCAYRPEEAEHVGAEIEERLLLAYKQYGADVFGRLIGEFVAAIWDPRQRELVLVADPLGRHTLYYQIDPTTVKWASRPRPLCSALSPAESLNYDYLADFLLNIAPRGSPYKHIAKVDPGCALSISCDSVKSSRYWALNLTAAIRYSTDTEYEEHFRSLFSAAIKCRINTRAPYYCELSGGIDSSSISCVAHDLEQHTRPQRMRTVSYTFPKSQVSDESVYIAAVQNQLNVPHVNISDLDCPILTSPPYSILPDFPTNDMVFASRHMRLARIMKQCGARVILNGIGGDQLFWSTPHVLLPLLDALAEGRTNKVLSCARHCAAISGSHLLVTLIMGCRFYQRCRRQNFTMGSVTGLGDWFCPQFVKATNCAERLAASAAAVEGYRPSQSHQYYLVTNTMRDFALTRLCNEYTVEARYPYLDQRLVQFALAIPFEQSVRLPETRSIVRRSLGAILPAEIRCRTTKAGPTDAWLRSLVTGTCFTPSQLPGLCVTRYGIIDPDRFATVLHRARFGAITNASQLLATIALELWLRTLACPTVSNGTKAATTALLPKREAISRKENTHEYTQPTFQ